VLGVGKNSLLASSARKQFFPDTESAGIAPDSAINPEIAKRIFELEG
jgi:hypothetical protein